jgi:hypothetical protein
MPSKEESAKRKAYSISAQPRRQAKAHNRDKSRENTDGEVAQAHPAAHLTKAMASGACQGAAAPPPARPISYNGCIPPC